MSNRTLPLDERDSAVKIHQDVFRVRRNYNRWVANQTLEDYALRFTSKKARRWSSLRVTNTALGAISFLALEAIGGAITLNYGFTNSILAILVVGLIIFLTAIPISYYAARNGVDIDLLTRGASFGYIGSTLTSLIYASFTFIFFAVEAAIMSMAIHMIFDIPLSICYIISALLVIPLVTHGITLISRFQLWTQPIWVALQLLPLAVILYQDFSTLSEWTQYQAPTEHSDGGFDLLLFGAASAVIFSLIAQIGEQVDFIRFLPEKQHSDSRRWWIAGLSGGPGWAVIGMIKVVIGSYLAWLAFSKGVVIEEASDPTHMYTVAFDYLMHSETGSLVLAGIFIILSQIKINVTNAYAGSIAWSNFFSRLTHNHPGRVVWLVFNVAIALVLMELGIYQALESILSSYSIVALAWVGALVADLTINMPLGLRPKHLEFKRAYLYDINPVGVGSMLIASITGLLCHGGLFGDTAEALAAFIALGMTFVFSPLLAWLTQGRYYLARPNLISTDTRDDITCCICEHPFEPEDMAQCPAYNGPICSLCCTLDARCQDFCKDNASLSEQINRFIKKLLPYSHQHAINKNVVAFFGILSLVVCVTTSLLLLIFHQIHLETGIDAALFTGLLWKISLVLLIIGGVFSWIFVLVNDSRRVAEEERNRQTQLLVEEIEAHEETDRHLQKAKELAEAANLAKSRYVSGISHELRTPLNSVLGYAQLLEYDEAIPSDKRVSIAAIRRNGEYLADLIEGLLDISKIEAGRLDLHFSHVRLPELIEQIVTMFQQQAEDKGIEFEFVCHTRLPDLVKCDEKRVRQILINLLSNAVKYTDSGKVTLEVRYHTQVAEFVIHDTGIGISEANLERIFTPFERIREPGQPYRPGTGLGLTITQLLTEIMGGDISVRSTEGQGSTFTLLLMLSEVAQSSPQRHGERRKIRGYEGQRKTVITVDDDPAHRGLIQDSLSPLGFTVLEASDGAACLELLKHQASPDLFLLDVSMPGMNGWELAAELRQQHHQAPIIMLSATPRKGAKEFDEIAHCDYLLKPMRLSALLDKLASTLALTWIYADSEPMLNASESPIRHSGNEKMLPQTNKETAITRPSAVHCASIAQLAKIGYASGIHNKLSELEQEGVASEEFLQRVRQLLAEFRFDQIIKLVDPQHGPSK